MKTAKILTGIILLLSMSLSLVAGEPNQRIPASDPRFLYEGRLDFSDKGAPVVIWEASRIGLDFEGDTLELIFDAIKGQNYINAEIDGQNTIVEANEGKPVKNGSFSGLGQRRHRLSLFKRSEANAGTLQFRGVDLAPGAQAWAPQPPAYKLKMEFFGDSCSVGACNEDGPVEQWKDRRTHNSALSYTTLLASELAADHRNISVSGMGVVTGYTKVKTDEILDRLYPTKTSPPADQTMWTPDVVFVAVGGNDFLFTAEKGQPFPENFAEGYIALVRSVRAAYPAAHIVLLGGTLISEPPRTEALDKAWEAAVQRIEAGDDKSVSHYVCKHVYGGHPKVADHRALAQEIVGWLKQQRFMQPYL
ncbi:MAG: GDSL-type esterase/lipase family protein [Verrucomicrobiae bacterium]